MKGFYLTAWAGLFIWYFQMRKRAENHKLVRRVFCLTATGFLIGTALCFPIGVQKDPEDSKAELQLERGALGSQSTEETLEVSVGNRKPKRITLSVPARAYTKEEIEEEFNTAIEFLDEAILGENSSFSSVNQNLDLITEIPGSPVTISWSTDQPLLIDSRGLLSDEISEQGEEAVVKARLHLQDQEEEYIRKVRLYPPQITEADLIEKLKKEVQKKNEAHPEQAAYELPDTLNGETVTWKRPADTTGLKLMFLSVIAGAACWAAEEENKKKQKKEREEQMLKDYPELISKMVLLLGAGLSMRKVLERMTGDYRRWKTQGGAIRYGYEELLFTWQEMENGISEQEAYQRMGMRCSVGRYRSLAALLTQNLKKGSKGLLELLRQEAQEALEERRREAKTSGETASTKLLLPMGMMLAVVLVILTIPAFLSFYA